MVLMTNTASSYAPDFVILPSTEVDYGVFWTNAKAGPNSQTGWRVTYRATEQDVVAVRGDETVQLAARIPFIVVETLLNKPLNTVGLGTIPEVGWAKACNSGKDISWVAERLARWSDCLLVTYKPKAGTDRWEAQERALTKAVREHCFIHGNRFVGGGWYRTRDGLGRTYAQGIHDYKSVAARTLLDLGVASDGTYRYAVAR